MLTENQMPRMIVTRSLVKSQGGEVTMYLHHRLQHETNVGSYAQQQLAVSEWARLEATPSSSTGHPNRDSEDEHKLKHKHSTRDRLNIESEEFRKDVFNKQSLSCGLTINGTPKMQSVVQMKENMVPELRPSNDLREEELVSRSELTETLINNGFNQASVKALFPMVSTELSGSKTRIDQSGVADQKSSYHRVIYYYQATIKLTTETVEPTEDFVSSIRDALSNPNISEKYTALKTVFDRFGYIWAQKITLGGKITVSEKLEGHQTDSEKKTKALATAKASVNAAIAGLGQTGAGAGFTIDNEKGSSDAAAYVFKSSHLRVVAANTFAGGRASWEASLKNNPSTWQVILREELIPIYELLDDTLLPQVKQAMEVTLNLERVTTSSKLTIRNVETNHSLGWKKFYYGSTKGYPGMVVTTCPLMSGNSNESMVWTFVKSPSNNDRGPHIRFGDIVFIQPASVMGTTSNKLYLHGSHRQDAPVTKTAREVSLRFFANESPNENDEWMILPCDDGSGDAGADIDLDVSMRRSSYLTKTDRFKLRHRTTDKHYLASHKITIESIRVRKKPNEANPPFSLHPPMLKDNKNVGDFATRFYEVLLLEAPNCTDQKDIWEILKKD
ncbi:hypothetical protein BC938DRAFT_475649 [Jimgerdemannia flammicorona]|uniref:MACPF-like domain-containing protein n=1 Tax=Jimgerdemannia flammicorona TaxID=994334 RepID=A0A433PQZ8_9FUNG|nr:hypothetical protein BC938DRAFT_475649 [Jimgerdemannia flammicorona]